MKKLFALVICSVFVLSMSSFALWGMGKKAETKTATVETKPMAKKMVTKKAVVKKVKKVKVKKAAPAMPVKK